LELFRLADSDLPGDLHPEHEAQVYAADLVRLLVDDAHGLERELAFDLHLFRDLAAQAAHQDLAAPGLVHGVYMPADADGQKAVQPLLPALLEPAEHQDLVSPRQDDVGDDLPVGGVLLHLGPGPELVLRVHNGQYLFITAPNEAVLALYISV